MSERLSTAKRFGRPRRVTLEQVIDAACEIGLERLDMTALAQKLGTGVATLYGYVESRDHLLRLVAGRLTSSGVVTDRAQSWEDALREYALGVFQAYSAWPQLIVLQVNGRLGDPTASNVPESLLRLLIARGLTPLEAVRIYSQVNQIVSGAALAASCYDRLSAEAGGEQTLSARMRGACETHSYGALQVCLEVADLRDIAADYRPALECLIADQVRRMDARLRAIA